MLERNSKKDINLAVIVPVYNTEEYVQNCLKSILNLKFNYVDVNMTVIVINDGSRDDSILEINRFLKAKSDRIKQRGIVFKIMSQENKGLGVARNRGLAEVMAGNFNYVAFVDSDDLVTRNGLGTLLFSLEESGSDLATGNVLRFQKFPESKYGLPLIKRSSLHKLAIKRNCSRTSIFEHNELVYDTTAWNKVYRVSFLKKHKFKFPEGVLFEDFQFVTNCYLNAKIDIIKDSVYLWRRHQGTITTQTDDKSKGERKEQLQVLWEMYSKTGDSELVMAFKTKISAIDKKRIVK